MATRFHRGMTDYKLFCVKCSDCGGNTSKQYARSHQGKCKSCFTGEAQPYRGPKCPQCGAPISAYKAAHHYVCERCTRENDPVGWANEVRGLNQ
jgi:hypothetical protein